jgi:hypothetical protein
MAVLEQSIFACHAAPTRALYPITSPVVVTVASDLGRTGNSSAQLTHKIFQGVIPANLPVETIDFLETLDLKTTRATGLVVSGDFPFRADSITRQASAIATESEGDCRLQGPGWEERDIR